MRIRDDMKYSYLGLVQPEGGTEVVERTKPGATDRLIPYPEDVSTLSLIDRHTGETRRTRSSSTSPTRASSSASTAGSKREGTALREAAKALSRPAR